MVMKEIKNIVEVYKTKTVIMLYELWHLEKPELKYIHL